MKQIVLTSQQPDPEGPEFGRVAKPSDLSDMQTFMQQMVRVLIRDLLLKTATGPQVTGFGATLAGGLGVEIAAGEVYGVDGNIYDFDEAATVQVGAANAANPRIDLIVAALEVDAPTDIQYEPFKRLLANAEILAGTVYTIEQFNVATRLSTRATIAVRQGVAAADPAPPVPAANEVPLWRVHVAANQTNLGGGDLTDVRPIARSLTQALTLIDALNAAMAVLPEMVQDIVGAFVEAGDASIVIVYNDVGGIESIKLAPAYKALLDNATDTNTASTLVKRDASGNFSAGVATLNPPSAPVGGSSQPGLALQAPDNSEAIVLTLGTKPLFGHAVGGGKFAVIGVPDQNNCSILFFNNRGGNPGSDKLRWMNDELGRTYQYGEVHILVDQDGLGGSLSVLGSFTAGSKAFLIDHPLHPTTKNLRHSAIEAPRRDLIYRGVATFTGDEDPDGVLTVYIDEASGMEAGTFDALCMNAEVYLQPKAAATATSRPYPSAVADGRFTIHTGTGLDTVGDVAWMVVAERKDEYALALPDSDEAGHLIVEEDKPIGDAGLLGDGERTTRAVEAAPDETVTEIVSELIGTAGYPIHAAFAPGLGPVPMRDVTIHIDDEEGNPYGGGD